MKWIVWLVMLFSLSSFGQGVSKPPMKFINIAGINFYVQDLAPISGYTRIFARYEWTSGAFNNVLYVPRYNGVPTGAPTGENADIDGKVAIDTANSYFYYYSGGAWVKVAKFSDAYTNLTQFVSQGNWKLFYSNGSGDVTELSLGTSGKVLTSNGTTSAPTFETPSTVATAVPLSGITAATGTNSINNANYQQTWNWNSFDGDGINGLLLNANTTATVNSSDALFAVAVSGTNAASGVTSIATSINNNHAGTSSTNIGLQVSAINGTAANYALIVPASSGSVGIGTSTPTSLAHINGSLQLGTATSTLGQLLMSGNTSGTVTLKTAAAAGTWSMTLPTTDGDADQVLKTDGNGVTSWTTASGGGLTVGTTTITSGTSGAIPFNNAGVYDEDAAQLFWDNSNNRIGIGTSSFSSIGVTTKIEALENSNTPVSIVLTNANAGAAAQAAFIANNGTNRIQFGVTGTGYTPYGALNTNNPYLYTAGATGITFMADNAAGAINFATGGNAETMRIEYNGNVGINEISPTTKLHVAGRMASTQGADVASAAGAIALGSGGNSFEITGTSAITLISNVGWMNGAEVTLIFTSTATLTDGTANSGTDIGMELAGNANFVASADDVITLVLCEVGGTQRWREKSRSVN